MTRHFGSARESLASSDRRGVFWRKANIVSLTKEKCSRSFLAARSEGYSKVFTLRELKVKITRIVYIIKLICKVIR